MSTDLVEPRGVEPHRDRPLRRIVHLHIPKTAGSALFQAFRQAYGASLRVYPERFESDYGRVEYSGFDFYTGHIGFKVASDIGGDFITMLRDPVDRFLSTYYHLRRLRATGAELTHKTSLAARFDLDQFVEVRDEPILHQEFRNRMTWQIAHSHRLSSRNDLIEAGVDGSELVRLAIANLGKFAIVGIQADMPGLAEAIRQKYAVALAIGRVNVTGSGLPRSEISAQTLSRLEWWIHLDQEFYQAWIGRRALETAPSPRNMVE